MYRERFLNIIKDHLYYIVIWLSLPLYALRHKVKRISHYEIVTEKGDNYIESDIVTANFCYDTICRVRGYGNYIYLTEVYKNGHMTIIKRHEEV